MTDTRSKQLEDERERMEKTLECYTSGMVRHFDSDESGLHRDVTADQMVTLRRRIADVDRRLRELDSP
jgi:hypothetical protein